MYKTGVAVAGCSATRQRPRCDPGKKYRSADGTCNNVNQPFWGSYAHTLERFMGPEYGDGSAD